MVLISEESYVDEHALPRHIYCLLHIFTSTQSINANRGTYKSKICRLSCKTCVKRPLSKRPKIGVQYQLSLNAVQTHCRMIQGEHSVILSTFINYHVSIRSMFCLFLIGRFTQVLLYMLIYLYTMVLQGH